MRLKKTVDVSLCLFVCAAERSSQEREQAEEC